MTITKPFMDKEAPDASAVVVANRCLFSPLGPPTFGG